jgi:hypothetical protein
MAKRYTRNKRRRKTRKIRGGFDLNETIPHSDDDSHYLDINESFQSQGSLHPSDLDISQINDSGYTTEQTASLGEAFDLDSIPNAEDESHYLDSNSSLHLSDLNLNGLNESGYTTSAEDESFGGKRHRKSYKKRRGKKTRKNRRKQKGGVCYGNGVGANNYDPNYSIYNTNMLKLFPYKA